MCVWSFIIFLSFPILSFPSGGLYGKISFLLEKEVERITIFFKYTKLWRAMCCQELQQLPQAMQGKEKKIICLKYLCKSMYALFGSKFLCVEWCLISGKCTANDMNYMFSFPCSDISGPYRITVSCIALAVLFLCPTVPCTVLKICNHLIIGHSLLSSGAYLLPSIFLH